MRSKRDDIRRRIAQRKKASQRHENNLRNRNQWVEDDLYEVDQMMTYDYDEPDHPLFRKEVFIFKILASACLVLIIAILFRNQSESLHGARDVVKKTMEQEFEFAAISGWYEKQFGKPLAILPFSDKKIEEAEVGQQYALPATGKIIENFKSNGTGIMIETEKGAAVKTMNAGRVIFAGEKAGVGKTVILQHEDKSESWYGGLHEIKVSFSEYIDKGKVVGTVSSGQEDTTGHFYFAIKKGEDFIDPNQVIRFE